MRPKVGLQPPYVNIYTHMHVQLQKHTLMQEKLVS